jgi:uncharacterized membrane protein
MDDAANAATLARTVEAGRGVAWWSEAWALLVKAPALWVVFGIVLFIVMVVVSLIPIVGSLAATLVLPVFLGGWMLAARKVEEGGTLEVGDLFACFRGEVLTPLIVVGVLLLAGVVVIGLVVGMLGLGAVFGLMGGGSRHAGGMFAALGTALLAVLLSLVLGALLTMATWFAPALVVFRRVQPVDALKQSFAASLRNIVPFLLWGLIYLVAAIAASIPFGLGWIALVPLSVLTAYVSYRDVFGF